MKTTNKIILLLLAILVISCEDIFEEKRKQIRESYDTEQAIADVIERWKN